MIVVRAPLRISFIGGGSDLPDFYHNSQGRVISGTIDKFVFLAINPTPMIDKISLRYSKTETVDSPAQLQHPLVRAALLDLGIKSNIEIGSFASLPAKTGLGSSSSFSVALLKGLYFYAKKDANAKNIAEAACRLEIELAREPIGKQDQYASAVGGFNVFQFNKDESVDVENISLDCEKTSILEKHSILFFTGIRRNASSVLSDQKLKIADKFETYKKMADLVPNFKAKMLAGEVKGMADILQQGWLYKKSFSSNISSSLIDELYETGIKAGAFGGKILGAGGGGCLYFLAKPEKHSDIIKQLKAITDKANLFEARHIPFKFTSLGVDLLLNSES